MKRQAYSTLEARFRLLHRLVGAGRLRRRRLEWNDWNDGLRRWLIHLEQRRQHGRRRRGRRRRGRRRRRRGSGTTSSSASGAGGGDPSGDTIRFIGRFDTTNAEGPRFSWAGSAIVTRFSGTSLGVRFNDESTAAQSNFFQVVIDGEAKGVLKVNSEEDLYTVADGLPDGEHDLVLHRRTEPLVGVSQFLEFVPEQGEALLPVPAAPEHRIEVIGDSISAGYGVDGANETCPFTSDTENNYLAYSALTGRLVGAETTIVAWSGRGVYRNYNGEVAPTMPEIYGRTIADEEQPAWDFSSWVPQVVVINLGTNDFSINVQATPSSGGRSRRPTRASSRRSRTNILWTVSPAVEIDAVLQSAKTVGGDLY